MVFATPKVKVKLRRRDKRVQRHVNRIRAYHKRKSKTAFATYYKNAEL